MPEDEGPVDASGFATTHGKLRLDGVQLVDAAGAPVQLVGMSEWSGELPFHIVDVFTTGTAMTGNQLLVIEDRADALSDSQMQSIAAEIGFAESAFMRAAGGVRIFTVDEEVKHDGNIYVIRESLGQGSFGTTYRATTNDGDDIALKVLSFRNMKNWKALELFEREARTLKGLNHPAIPQYVDNFELDTDGDRFFCLAQRIAPGRSLQSLVDGGWRPTEPEVVAIAEQLLEVLGYLSSLRPPVCHRDVKPGNVLLDVETGRVSLVDFGATADAAVTTAMAAEETTGGGYAQGGSTVVGTFGYCAPELYMGAVTPRSDLYSVGATALFLLSGRAPSTMPSTRLRVDFRGVTAPM